MTEPTDLETAAREWYAAKPAAQRAAAELVIWKGLLRRRDFIREAVMQSDLGVSIDWPSARRFAMARAMSGSERTILELAADLGQGQLLPAGTAELGDAHRRAAADAVSRALGIEPGAPPPGPALNFAEALDVGEARRRLAALSGIESAGSLAASVRRLLDIVDRIVPEEGRNGS